MSQITRIGGDYGCNRPHRPVLPAIYAFTGIIFVGGLLAGLGIVGLSLWRGYADSVAIEEAKTETQTLQADANRLAADIAKLDEAVRLADGVGQWVARNTPTQSLLLKVIGDVPEGVEIRRLRLNAPPGLPQIAMDVEFTGNASLVGRQVTETNRRIVETGLRSVTVDTPSLPAGGMALRGSWVIPLPRRSESK